MKRNIKKYCNYHKLASPMKEFTKDLMKTFVLTSCIIVIVACIQSGAGLWLFKFCVGITVAMHLFMFLVSLAIICFRNVCDKITKKSQVNKLETLKEWLLSQKYLVDENSQTSTEQWELDHMYELSRNITINKTIKKIEELNTEN